MTWTSMSGVQTKLMIARRLSRVLFHTDAEANTGLKTESPEVRQLLFDIIVCCHPTDRHVCTSTATLTVWCTGTRFCTINSVPQPVQCGAAQCAVMCC